MTSRRPPSSDVVHVPAEGRPTTGAGLGLFATAPIEAGTVAVSFGGEIVPAAEFERLPAERQRHSVQIGEHTYLVTGEQRGLGDLVNHSCDPTGVLVDGFELVARRRIEAGEQITYDYATSDASPYDEFECFCMSPGCRRKVTGQDWMLPEIQQRYRGYFSPYVQRLIDDLG